jgi:hypothetical protein
MNTGLPAPVDLGAGFRSMRSVNTLKGKSETETFLATEKRKQYEIWKKVTKENFEPGYCLSFRCYFSSSVNKAGSQSRQISSFSLIKNRALVE